MDLRSLQRGIWCLCESDRSPNVLNRVRPSYAEMWRMVSSRGARQARTGAMGQGEDDKEKETGYAGLLREARQGHWRGIKC
jgi:hypothetical protein